MIDKSIVLLLIASVLTLIGKIVFDWLKSRKPKVEVKCPLDRSSTIKAIQDLKDSYGLNAEQYAIGMADIKWLKEIHNIKDSDGIPLWYVPRTLIKTMIKLSEETTKQSITLEHIAGILSQNGNKLEALVKNGRG